MNDVDNESLVALPTANLAQRAVATSVLAGVVWSVIECVDWQVFGDLHFARPGRLPLFWLTHLSIGIAACLTLRLLFAVSVGVLARRLRPLLRQMPMMATSVSADLLLFGFHVMVWAAGCLTGLFLTSHKIVGIGLGVVLFSVWGLLLHRRHVLSRRPHLSVRLAPLRALAALAFVVLAHVLNREVYSKQYFTLHVALNVFALTAALGGAQDVLRWLRRPRRVLLPLWTTVAISLGLVFAPVGLFTISNDVRHALFRAFDCKTVLYLARRLPFPRGYTASNATSATPALPNGSSPANRRRWVERILLVTIDTLRADHLPMYGYARDTAPSMRAFARGASTFEWAWSGGPSTSMALPVLFAREGRTPDLAAALTKAKISRPFFVTANGMDSFIGSRWLESVFDRVVTVDGDDTTIARTAEREIDGGRFSGLMWVHMMAPHRPYRQREPNPFGPTDIDRYDAEILESDRAVGTLLSALDRNGLADSTAVIITSDHGEEFGDHGGEAHGLGAFNELLHIPLMIRAPGMAPRRVPSNVSHWDLPNTIAELFGIEVGAAPGARSLRSMLAGADLDLDRPVLIGPVSTFQIGALIWRHWKLSYSLFNGSYGLYDQNADPRERSNVFEAQPELASNLVGMLSSAIRDRGGLKR